MKVAVNRCYGGFGLSPKAIKELVLRNASCIESYTPKEYYGGNNPNFKDRDWESVWNKDKSKYCVDLGDGFFTEEHFAYNLLKDDVLYSLNRGEENRTNKDLIEVIELFGKDASARLGNVQVIEIPDGVNFEIDDYDGMETIREKHRSW